MITAKTNKFVHGSESEGRFNAYRTFFARISQEVAYCCILEIKYGPNEVGLIISSS